MGEREGEKIKIMVFFVVHELRNGNGSCFSASEFLNRFLFRVHSKSLEQFFSSLFLHIVFAASMFFAAIFLKNLQACIVCSLHND